MLWIITASTLLLVSLTGLVAYLYWKLREQTRRLEEDVPEHDVDHCSFYFLKAR